MTAPAGLGGGKAQDSRERTPARSGGPVSQIKDDVLTAMMPVIERQSFIMGPEVAQLEAKIARLSHAKHGIACASGTDALCCRSRLWI